MQDVQPIWPVVRVELTYASELIEVELTRERAAEQGLANGQQLWLKPRQLKVFPVDRMVLEEGGSGI